jgi:transposase
VWLLDVPVIVVPLGVLCYVVAPSLIPKKPGERVKTDKRDSLKLTQLLKSGDLNPIYVPAEEDEAVRDLSRARKAAMHDLNDARYRLKALLLRNHIQYTGKADWRLKHQRWLTEINMCLSQATLVDHNDRRRQIGLTL